MSVKRTGQLSFVEALLPEGLPGSGRLDRLSELVKWYRFEKLLARLRDPGPGRPGYPVVVMFKALLLQSLYGLSDAELEEALPEGEAVVNVSEKGLRDWHARFAPQPAPCGEDATTAELREENKRLRQQLRRAELEREILKKATAYFAKESQ